MAVSCTNFPFELDWTSKDSLTDQLTKGLRDAIHSRFYRANDILPAMPDLARHLGVSEIIVRTAYRRLAEEGLVLSRPKRGSTVLPSKSPVWRGHVLCVTGDHDFNYQLAVGVEATRDILSKSGFLFSQVSVLRNSVENIETCGLETALSRSPDFIVLFYDIPQIVARLSAAGIPFVVIGGKGALAPGCVGRIGTSDKNAIVAIVRQCRCAHIGYVEIVSCSPFDDLELRAAKALRTAGMTVKRTVVDHQTFERYRCENAMHDGYGFVERSLAKRGFRFPDLYFVTDDWIAAGMLSAFQAHNVRLPEDVRFICYSNRGFGPIYSKSLAFFACDPFKRSEEISRRIFDYLVLHKPFPDSYLECEYMPGDTFPE